MSNRIGIIGGLKKSVVDLIIEKAEKKRDDIEFQEWKRKVIGSKEEKHSGGGVVNSSKSFKK